MNLREFAGFAALAPLLGCGTDLKTTRAEKPFTVLPDSARVYDIGRGEARILVGEEQSGGVWWLGHFRNDPGRLTSLHVHHSAMSSFMRSKASFPCGWMAVGTTYLREHLQWCRGERRTPSGTTPKEAVRFLNSGNPAGFERFFADIETTGRHFPYGSPEFAELMKVYKKYDTEMLGAAPQR